MTMAGAMGRENNNNQYGNVLMWALHAGAVLAKHDYLTANRLKGSGEGSRPVAPQLHTVA